MKDQSLKQRKTSVIKLQVNKSLSEIYTSHKETILGSHHFLFLPLMIFCTALVSMETFIANEWITPNVLPLPITIFLKSVKIPSSFTSFSPTFLINKT